MVTYYLQSNLAMTKYISLFAFLLLSSSFALAQKVNTPPNRASEPAQAYPITNTIGNVALKEFEQNFPSENVGFLHIYTDPSVDPEEVYLLRGLPVSSTVKALLPIEFQRMARTMNADLYGAMAVKGVNESLYILRMDGQASDRIEMFALRGNEVVHLKTLAYRTCSEGSCAQLDTYLTDLDGDTNLDLVQIERSFDKNGETARKPRTYVMNTRNGKWKKTNKLEVPVNSIPFYDPKTDNQ